MPGKSLVIVESPAKAKTINKYLGDDYVVKASMGHVRDLPKSELGVEVKKGSFTPRYEVLEAKKKVVQELKKAAKGAKAVYLACDFDREGEAIAWHLAEVLKAPADQTFRVTFNEITEPAIRAAFDRPAKVSMDLVNAQQARRVLDRLVGYELSPLLWKKIVKGLSAGRVQSVAVKLVVEREHEIRHFKPEEYWKVVARLRKRGGGAAFEAELRRLLTPAGEEVEAKLGTGDAARALVAEVAKGPWRVREVERSEKREKAPPPFQTSSLQQQAATRLYFSTKRTMALAQQLYEGVDLGAEGSVGLITYMRTDSLNVSEVAIGEVRELVSERFGEVYLPEKPHRYKAKKGAQEAHEAIRPTSVRRTPESVRSQLTHDQWRLYRLIWQRFVASQMQPAVFDQTSADVASGRAIFRATGRVLRFDGFLAAYGVRAEPGAPADAEGATPESALAGDAEEAEGEGKGDKQAKAAAEKSASGGLGTRQDAPLPPLEKGEALDLEKIDATQHFTQPPARYTEASLVKTLEKEGIGRPSTYATIISTIQERGYVAQKDRKFHATDLGIVVTEKLLKHFPDIMATEFTARMEEELDEVEEAKADWQKVLKEFYDLFEADLARAKKEMRSLNEEPVPSDYQCPKCGKTLVYKWARTGQFLGCSGYPECKSTVSIGEDGEPRFDEETKVVCDKCGKPMVLKTGRRGKFLACSAYPDCKNAVSVDAEGKPIPKPKVEETDEKCEKCGARMVVKEGRRGRFLACSAFPKCRNARDLPEVAAAQESNEALKAPCDKCGKPMALKRGRRGPFAACTGYPECKNTRPLASAGERPAKEPPKETGEACDKCGRPMVVRFGRRGAFAACSGYPTCKNAKPLPKEGEGKAAPPAAATALEPAAPATNDEAETDAPPAEPATKRAKKGPQPARRGKAKPRGADVPAEEAAEA